MHIKNPIILFDGVCNLCNGTVDFLIKHDKQKQFKYIALQSEEGKKIVQQYQFAEDIDSVILVKSENIFFESDAVVEISRLLGFPWNLVVLGKIIPKKIRDGVYRFISKHRYRWFGKRKTCRIPPSKAN